MVSAGDYTYIVSTEKGPKNVFLLFLPEKADLETLHEVYPQEQRFKFPEEEVKRKLAETDLPEESRAKYVELLRRGGAIYFTRKNGKRVLLTVQPGNKVLEEVR